MPIKSIQPCQTFDSVGNPTVEVDLSTELSLFRAAVPSGASNGPELIKANLEVTEQEKIDELTIKLVGTENKSKYHATAILGILLALCKVGVAKKGLPL
uniref:Enolase n=1 Tax=Glossina pallidipes TaxID=7398 RepID=A0A1B0A7N8_GLOPL